MSSVRSVALCFFLASSAGMLINLSACCGTEGKAIYNSEKGQPTAVAEAVGAIDLPDGFTASLFANEPDVQQPIAVTTDERGRLWVAENYTYAEAAVNFDKQLRDRVVILEDTNGDGKADKRVVFWDEGKLLSSVEVGHGGVWVLCAPQLLFIPDRNRDDVPDGPPEVVLDGWDDNAIRHNIVNGLKWGPDGWLYGRHGILATSSVGKPNSAPSQRQKINCGVWRYHPTRQEFEVVAHGTTNPWGFDYDEYGEMFFINTVIGHLWHLVPGAHYQRMFGADFNPHLYGLIGQTADHFHWDTGEKWNDIHKGITDTTLAAGGGHAHSGLMAYLGDNWPDRYRNSLFTLNFHGRRINHDRIERLNAGYVGKHEDDLFFVQDAWFRGIDLLYGPDGSVFIADWSDNGECHDNDGVHRTSGRIYRLYYDTPPSLHPFDLSDASDAELVDLQLHENDWYVRQARRLLQERANSGKDLTAAHKLLLGMFEAETEERRQLRAMWALSVSNGIDDEWLIRQLNHSGEHIRAWAVRLLADRAITDQSVVDALTKLTTIEPSGLVRLYLASAMQRLPVQDRWDIATALASRVEDAGDRQLPLLIWYGLEPAVGERPDLAVELCSQPLIPLLRQHIARRVTSDFDSNQAAIDRIIQMIANSEDAAFQLGLLRGMNDALRGRRKAAAPSNWSQASIKLLASRDADVQQIARQLGIVFGDGQAISELQQIASDQEAAPESRRNALRSLVDERADETLPLLKRLLTDFSLSSECVRGFAAFDDPAIPTLILGRFNYLDPDGKAWAIDTLSSRPAYAKALLAALEQGIVPRELVTASHARQLQGFKDDSIATDLERLWGAVRTSPDEKKVQIEALMASMTPARLAAANQSNGRKLFVRTCASCHVLYGQGTLIGPDLTGSNRRNLAYLCENIVDPSSSVAKEFRTTAFLLEDGRSISGVVLAKTDHSVTIRTQSEEVTIGLDEVEEMSDQELSLMPDGLLSNLSEAEVGDLFAYLMGDSQVTLEASH